MITRARPPLLGQALNPLGIPETPCRGRGAASNRTSRYEAFRRVAFDDGWSRSDAAPAPLRTTLTPDRSRTVISYNGSPDVPFDRSVNPYRGCEHGCIYCYARPTHAWLGLSPGLDFESRLFYKPDAALLLHKELGQPDYRCAPIALGGNTDPYQPVEKRLKLTREVLEVLDACSHPVTVATKSGMVERDIDVLAAMSERNLVAVYVSVTTMDRALARKMEPRAAAPHRRIETVRVLSAAGIPVTVLVAPVIPVLTDWELERILASAFAAGACSARYILLRLPRENKDLFQEWLRVHYPGEAAHITNRLRETQGGSDYDATFGRRMKGRGAYAEMLNQRFDLACRRLGFGEEMALDCSQFRAPSRRPGQLRLF